MATETNLLFARWARHSLVLSNLFKKVHFTAETDSLDALACRAGPASNRQISARIDHVDLLRSQRIYVANDSADVPRVSGSSSTTIRFLQRKALIASALAAAGRLGFAVSSDVTLRPSLNLGAYLKIESRATHR